MALGLIGAFSGPNRTQNRFDLQRVYFLKPNGEVISQKVYADSTTFNVPMLKTYYFYSSNMSNTKIAQQVLFDLE